MNAERLLRKPAGCMIKFDSDIEATTLPRSSKPRPMRSNEQSLMDQVQFWKEVAKAKELLIQMLLAEHKATMNFIRSKNQFPELSNTSKNEHNPCKN